MRIHLEKNNSENLILFFCGWGMDENPFFILNNTSDVLYVYDYTTPEFCGFDFSAYKKAQNPLIIKRENLDFDVAVR